MSNNQQYHPVSQQRVYQREKEDDLQQALIYRQHDEFHIKGGQFLKSLVYAGVDGTTNVLVIILSGISSLTSAQVLLVCVSFIVSDSIGMGFGDYFSAKAEADFIQSEQQRQLYEVQHFLQAQKRQIINIYTKKGFQKRQAQLLAQLFATNKQAFVNIMMLEQLKLVKVDPTLAFKCGLVTVFSFVILGGMPIIPYLIAAQTAKDYHPWKQSTSIGAIQLFFLGFLKGHLIGINKWKSGAQILILGAVVTSIGYGIGLLFV